MKWTYKEHDVEITSTFDTTYRGNLTPIVEIACKDPADFHCLTTNSFFQTAGDAERFGATMAREWIDEHLTM